MRDDRREEAPSKSSALTALAAIEEHTTRLAGAIERGLAEGDTVGALARLRQELTEFENQLVRGRLDCLIGGDNPRLRARAADVGQLLESRRRPTRQLSSSTKSRAGGGGRQ